VTGDCCRCIRYWSFQCSGAPSRRRIEADTARAATGLAPLGTYPTGNPLRSSTTRRRMLQARFCIPIFMRARTMPIVRTSLPSMLVVSADGTRPPGGRVDVKLAGYMEAWRVSIRREPPC
jgi:hypothetical protein